MEGEENEEGNDDAKKDRGPSGPFGSSAGSHWGFRNPVGSAVGKEGPQRRASMSPRPNCESVIIMVIMAVVGDERRTRRFVWAGVFFAVDCSRSEGFHKGPKKRKKR